MILLLLVLTLFIAACAPQDPAARNVLISERAIDAVTPTPNVVFVTPTRQSTAIPTIELSTSTPTPSPTPEPTATIDVAASRNQCRAVMQNLYRRAIDFCLGKPGGYFCNGGVQPEAEPAGRVATALGAEGAVVDVTELTRVHTRPLLTNNSGGVLYLRLRDELNLSGLLIGDVEIIDATPANYNLPAWQSFTIFTTQHDSTCDLLPNSTFILQSAYGQSARIAVNGVSVNLVGTVAIQTFDDQTHFMVVEGGGTLTVNGRQFELIAGQQLDVDYNPGDWTRPSATPEQIVFLNPDNLRNFPSVIMDRPVIIPQPGYAVTTGNVNMRAQPTIEGRLLYQVPDDEVLNILGQSTDEEWFHVRLGNGDTGWMSREFLSVQTTNIAATYDATPAPPQRPGDLGKLAKVVSNSGSNLRTAPDVSFNVMLTLPAGTEVELVARSPYSPWVKVNSGGTVGWLSLLTIETRAAIAFLPIDYDVPAPARPTAVPVFDWGGGHAYPDPRNSG